MARTHLEHPPIIEAADGKWLGYKDVFKEYGVHIEFLDIEYAEMMYARKILNKSGHTISLGSPRDIQRDSPKDVQREDS